MLGGFTTFSAFGNETINLWRDGQSVLAAVNIYLDLLNLFLFILRLLSGNRRS